MMKVAVSGAGGRMGRLIVGAVDDAGDLEIAGLYGPGHHGETVRGHPISDDPDVCAAADVVVESTIPDVVASNVERWSRFGCHVVVGTSGVPASEIEAFWPEGQGCLIVPNFSIGAVLMMRFAEMAAPHFRAAEVVELHHDEKVDAPSGTSSATAERIGVANPEQRRRRDSEEKVPGVRGGRVHGVPIHSVRLPGLLAHQEVLMGNVGEVLTIRHDSTDRVSFMPGVLAAIRHVVGLSGVHVGLESALDL
jgi:4-hydroxy-tetrahydrodipicolinate reductase